MKNNYKNIKNDLLKPVYQDMFKALGEAKRTLGKSYFDKYTLLYDENKAAMYELVLNDNDDDAEYIRCNMPMKFALNSKTYKQLQANKNKGLNQVLPYLENPKEYPSICKNLIHDIKSTLEYPDQYTFGIEDGPILQGDQFIIPLRVVRDVRYDEEFDGKSILNMIGALEEPINTKDLPVNVDRTNPNKVLQQAIDKPLPYIAVKQIVSRDWLLKSKDLRGVIGKDGDLVMKAIPAYNLENELKYVDEENIVRTYDSLPVSGLIECSDGTFFIISDSPAVFFDPTSEGYGNLQDAFKYLVDELELMDEVPGIKFKIVKEIVKQ
jgi:hypothetical protein